MKKRLCSALLLLTFSAAARAQTSAPAGAPLAPDKAAEYVGVYAVSPAARFTVLTDPAGRLQVRLTGQPFFSIRSEGHDRFFVGAGQNELVFGRSPAGQVNSIALVQNGVTGQRTEGPMPTVLFLPADQLAEYVAHYVGPPAGEYEFTVHKGCLFLQTAGKRPLALFADKPDHFASDILPTSVTFERNHAGAVVALTLRQNGLESRLQPAPAK
jgi:hypothetical protein